MIASPSPSCAFRSLASSPSSLLSRFQGAIAGAILGYLIGDYYAGAGMTRPCRSTQTLDLSWLSEPTTRGRTSPLFYPKDSWDVASGTGGEGNAAIDLSLVPLLNAMVDMVDLGLSRGYAYSDADLQTFQSIPKSSTQAALILLPLLLLHHENPMNQRRAIAQALALWSAPSHWEHDVMILGATLSTALLPTLGISPELAPSTLHQSGAEFTCHCFLCQPHSYEMGLMALVNHYPSPPMDENWFAMTALLGAFLGGHGGFYGLPLRWQYAMLNRAAGGTGRTTVFLDAMPASSNSSPAIGGRQGVNVLPLAGLMQRITLLLARWSGIDHTTSREGNTTLWATVPPTVTAPRRLALDLIGGFTDRAS